MAGLFFTNQESDDFAQFQLRRLMKRSLVGQKIEDVRKEINSRISGDIETSLTQGKQASQVRQRVSSIENKALCFPACVRTSGKLCQVKVLQYSMMQLGNKRWGFASLETFIQ